jgi:uncharacterized protein YlaI
MGARGRQDPVKKFVCKHCKVQVISKTNLKAIFGREHGKHCPRRYK